MRRCAGFVARPASGTWCARQVPSTCTPSTIFGPVQPFGLCSTIMGQRGRTILSAAARALLDGGDLIEHALEGRGHLLVHELRVVAHHEVRLPAVAGQQALELAARNARQDGRIRDLVTVQVEDRQHRAVADRVEKLVRMPGGRQRPRLGLAVADDTGDDEIGIVERRAEGMRQGIAQLAALVDRARDIGRAVARDAAGKGELLEQALHARGVARHVRGKARYSYLPARCWRPARVPRGRDR